MRITADLTTDGAGIALDVDHPHNLQILDAAFVKSTPVVLTLDEAADLHAELGRLLSKRTADDVPADPQIRTDDDVHDRPEPGDELRWSDGEIWRVTGFDGHRVRFFMTSCQRNNESSLTLRAWSKRNDPRMNPTFTCVPHP